MLKSTNSSLTYEIDTGYNNYYYPKYNNNNYITQKILNLPVNNFNTNLSSYFNSLNNNFRNNYKNDYYTLYNPSNTFYNSNINNFSKQNINFNKSSNQKIILTYEYKNITPMEISNRTQEIINLQSQMCNLNNKTQFLTQKSKSAAQHKPKGIQRPKDIKFQSQKNFHKNKNTLFNMSNKNNYKFKKNKTFNHSINSKTSRINDSSHMFNRVNSIEQHRNNVWKEKYLKANEDIKKIKSKIEEIKNNNNKIEKRLKYVKEKEENKDTLYEDNNKIIDYDIKLLEKYNLSELIRKKQIDLIIKMQKEVNNMREKLQMLNENNLNLN